MKLSNYRNLAIVDSWISLETSAELYCGRVAQPARLETQVSVRSCGDLFQLTVAAYAPFRHAHLVQPVMGPY